MANRVDSLQMLFQPAVEALGCTLWGIEYKGQGKFSLLRVYIDKEGGVGVQDCADVSRQLSSLLDVEDPISGEYTLEVSSPGMERPLFTPQQFEAYTGHEVSIKLRVKFDNKRQFSGLIKGVENDEVLLVSDEDQYNLPIELIDKANLVAQF